jgi:ABC-type multidrug transport system ATPase subunit
MKQRFGIAQALLANPSLIIVDEPTAGLDPAERNRFYNLLSELGEQAVVILSTHIVDDVKELCTDMAIINRGEVLLKGNPKEAITQLEGKVYRKTVEKQELQSHKQEYRIIADKFLQGKPMSHILSDTYPGNGFESIQTDLEDVYFSHIFGNISTHSTN